MGANNGITKENLHNLEASGMVFCSIWGCLSSFQCGAQVFRSGEISEPKVCRVDYNTRVYCIYHFKSNKFYLSVPGITKQKL